VKRRSAKRKNKFRLDGEEVKIGGKYLLNSVPLDSGYDNWRSYKHQHVRVIGINHRGMVKLEPTSTYRRMPIGPGAHLFFPTSYLRKIK
jgi:hypothetical protein